MGKIRKSGGYRTLASFQTATLIYDSTYWFCGKFLNARTRTIDQMVQAARSGRQNIAEGSRASATSSQTELRLLNVARSSLEELLLDFEDYLRHRGLRLWARDSPEATSVRCVPRQFKRDKTDQTEFTDLTDQQRWALYARWLDSDDADVRANATICLIHQANFLLDQQITALEAQFISEGGYSEQLATARLAARANGSGRANPIPNCPECGKLMALRTAKRGNQAGRQFWGCTGYPDCKATCPV